MLNIAFWYAVWYEKIDIVRFLLDDKRVDTSVINFEHSKEINEMFEQYNYSLDRKNFFNLQKNIKL